MVDDSLVRKIRNVGEGGGGDFELNLDGILIFRGKLCVLVDIELRHTILTEVHSSTYAMHLGSNKMYRDLIKMYWWPRSK